MTKRSKGDGAWRELATGHAWDRMYRGQRLHATGRTKALAREDMKQQISRVDSGLPARDATITLGDWLADWRGDMLDARQSRRGPLKETTKETYRTLCKRHLETDPIAGIPLDKLKPSDVTRLLARLTGKRMADASRRQIYHILRIALEAARKDRMIAFNPTFDVDRPVVEQHEALYLSPADVTRLLEAAKESRYHEVLALVAATGMRRGEALALRWADVDVVSGVANIRGTLARVGGELVVTSTKTKKSTRRVVLVPAIVDLLAQLADKQDAERDRAANLWKGHTKDADGFVFTTETGQPVDPRNVFRTLQAAAKKAKITGVGIHTLRHSVATGMMDTGENVKVVSGLLGHASAEITLDIYTHETPEAQRHAVETWAAQIGL